MTMFSSSASSSSSTTSFCRQSFMSEPFVHQSSLAPQYLRARGVGEDEADGEVGLQVMLCLFTKKRESAPHLLEAELLQELLQAVHNEVE